MKLLHDPTVRRFVLPWAVLLGLILVELFFMVIGLGLVAPFIGLIMMGIIVAIPMELLSAPNAAKIFALAGAFWLVFILFGLGTLDPLRGTTSRPTSTRNRSISRLAWTAFGPVADSSYLSDKCRRPGLTREECA